MAGGLIRARRSVLVYALVAAAALAGLALVGRGARLDEGWGATLLALLAVEALAFRARGRATGWLASFDAGLAVTLCALVLVGPLGALVVALVPELVQRVAARRVRSVGTVGNVAARACECLVGGALLGSAPVALTTPGAFPDIFTAGLAMSAAGYVVGPLLYGRLEAAVPLRASVRAFAAALPVQVGVVILGALVTLAWGPLGVFALVGFALAVPLPQAAFGELARFAEVSEVERGAATRVYALAIADVLGLSRRERRTLADGLVVLGGGTPTRPPASLVDLTEAVLHGGERWDGTGEVAGLGGEWIPQTARIIAVADAWSALTARGTAQLSHEEALLGLTTAAGTRFDPAVVRAATTVIAAEAPYARRPAFLPRLHRVPVPRTLRRGALPRLLGAVAGG
jgi:HD domain-containing protein